MSFVGSKWVEVITLDKIYEQWKDNVWLGHTITFGAYCNLEKGINHLYII